ncbi:MAG: hypothetical protein ACYCXX_11315 [Acidiferrobacter thiooxydans]|jgi:hypothetical protein
MIDKAIGPAARTMRLVAITPAAAMGFLYLARTLVPLPWMTARFLARGMLADALGRDSFYLQGHRYATGMWIWRAAYHAVSASPAASAAVALATFLGGLVALGVNRLVWRAHTQPMRTID